jgi:rhomboid protease GluP
LKLHTFEKNYGKTFKLKTYIIKLKHILPTFFAITFGSIISLALVRWLFCLHFSIINLKEEIWTLWIPLLLPWLPITLWLRQRLRILDFKDNHKGTIGFQVISWMIITAVLCISQNYITTATGKLVRLSNCKEIEKVEKVRYYKLTNFSVASNFTGVHTHYNLSGKYNQNLNFSLFFVVPILVRNTDPIDKTPKYWYGIKYRQQISNKISRKEKEKKYQTFYKECITKMNNYNFHSLNHFERVPTSNDRENYLKAIKTRTIQSANDQSIILEPIQEKYEDRNGSKLTWLFISFTIGLSVLLFAIYWSSLSETE